MAILLSSNVCSATDGNVKRIGGTKVLAADMPKPTAAKANCTAAAGAANIGATDLAESASNKDLSEGGQQMFVTLEFVLAKSSLSFDSQNAIALHCCSLLFDALSSNLLKSASANTRSTLQDFDFFVETCP